MPTCLGVRNARVLRYSSMHGCLLVESRECRSSVTVFKNCLSAVACPSHCNAMVVAWWYDAYDCEVCRARHFSLCWCYDLPPPAPPPKAPPAKVKAPPFQAPPPAKEPPVKAPPAGVPEALPGAPAAPYKAPPAGVPAAPAYKPPPPGVPAAPAPKAPPKAPPKKAAAQKAPPPKKPAPPKPPPGPPPAPPAAQIWDSVVDTRTLVMHFTQRGTGRFQAEVPFDAWVSYYDSIQRRLYWHNAALQRTQWDYPLHI